jgi:hypothetical protein
MPQFIHLFDSKLLKRVSRLGITAKKVRIAAKVKGFYCVPVSRNYFKSHQWLRELKRKGVKSIHAAQFKIDDETEVYIGRYNEEPLTVKASEAVEIFEKHIDGLGLEIIVPLTISAKSITRIYYPNQVLGWRFHPEAKGKKPFCGCKYCNKGEINAYRVITESN